MLLDIIYNPLAGGAKKMARNIARVVKRLTERKISFKLHKTEYPKHATKITKDVITNGATTVVSMGGDGTNNEVLNGFDNFENVSFGIIPCGTGNDFASHVGLPLDVEKAVDVIVDKEPSYVDFMQLPTVRALNIVGTGVDCEILKKYSALKKKRKTSYYKCLFNTIFSYKCKDCSSTINGEKRQHKPFISCVANGAIFGGGIKMCPVADPTDGKLEFIWVDDMKGIKRVGALLKLNAGKILKHKKAHRLSVDKVIVESNEKQIVNVDGELYDDIPFEVEVVHKKLRLHK